VVESPPTKLKPAMCSVAALRKAALPRQRVGDDGRQVVELRLPSERGTDAVGRRYDLGGIAGPAARELTLKSAPETRFTASITSSTEKPRP
jgi:hypothetical protein